MNAKTIKAKSVRIGCILSVNRKPRIVIDFDRRTNLTQDYVRVTFEGGVVTYYQADEDVRLVGYEMGPLP